MFAAYLTEEYPGLDLEYRSVRVDPNDAQSHRGEYDLGDVDLGGGRPVAVSIIEWNIPTDRVLHLCDAKGISLHETQVGQQIRAPGFNFTAYVKSDHLRELDKDSQLVLAEMHLDVDVIVKAAKGKIEEHFRRRLVSIPSFLAESASALRSVGTYRTRSYNNNRHHRTLGGRLHLVE